MPLTLLLSASPAAAAVLTTHDKVGICHAIGGPKAYVTNSPNIDSIVKGTGHGGHVDDIIPAFDYDLGAGVKHYAGQNVALISILNNNCGLPATARAVAPTVVQSQCVNNAGTVPTYTIVPVAGVVYSVGGTPVTGTNNGAAGSAITVVATAASAAITLTGSTSFPITFAATPTPCGSTPAGPGPGSTGDGGGPALDGNLGVTKTGTATAQPDDELVWSIVVTNTSGAAATGFTVADRLAPGLSFSQVQGNDFVCTLAGPNISCGYTGSLAVGASATISVRALLDAGYKPDAVTNTAVLTPGRPDTDSADNSSTAITAVTHPAEEFTGGGGGAVVAPPAETAGGGAALPFTGSSTARLAQAALALLLLGGYLQVLGRRRRPEVIG